jgi:carbamoyl-phosphate synthase large subunit
MKKRNILVTATGGRSVGSGILHALHRSSPEVSARWNIVASDADTFAWGLYKVSQAALLPLASAPDYFDRLRKIIKDFSIDAVIPGSEPEVDLLTKNPGMLDVPVISNRAELVPLMMDKFRMTARLRELGLPLIETFPVQDWKKALSHYSFPFIIKPTVGTGGSKGLHFVFSEEEIETILPQLPPSGNYCIQYTVGVLTDSAGAMVDSIVMRRKLIGLSLLHSRSFQERQYAVSTGYSQGFFIKDEAVQSFCESLALTLGSTGPLNIQLRKDGDRIYVFEIHPRFSGTTTMRADVGFNEPDVLLRNVLDGEQFTRLNYRYNVAAIRAFEHVIVPIDDMLRP